MTQGDVTLIPQIMIGAILINPYVRLRTHNNRDRRYLDEIKRPRKRVDDLEERLR